MKKITIAQVETEATNLPIWALNGSAEVREIADVLIGIPKLNGSKVDTLRVPATWLPVCLTEQIPRAQLLASAEFRQSVSSGILILIDPAYAQEVLEQDGAVEEQARLRETEQRVRDALSARGLHTDNVSLISGAELASTTPNSGQEIAANELDPAFVIFFESLAEKTDMDTMNAIRTRARFRRQEIRYMANHLIEKPKSQTLVRSLLDK